MADAPATTAVAAALPAATGAPQAAPAPVSEGQAPAAPPEPDPSLPPRHAELGKWAAKQKAQRDERAQRDADARDAAAYRAMLAQGFTPRQAAQQVNDARDQQPRPPSGDFDPNDYDAFAGRFKDPGELRGWLNKFAAHIANPQAGRLHREVEQLKQRQPEGIEEMRQAVKQLQEERAREQQTAVDRSFLAATEAKEGEAAKFPLLAKHPQAQRFAAANQVINDYRAAGWDGELPMDLVLQGAEDLLTDHYRGLGFLPAAESTPPPAPAAVPDAKPEPAKRSPSTPTRRPPGSRSLSNDHVATPTAPRPTDPAELDKWTKARHAQRRRVNGPAL